MRTPMGKLTPETANTIGIEYISICCCFIIGLSMADAGMFFIVGCLVVMKVVTDIAMIRTTATIFTLVTSLDREVVDSGAPRRVEASTSLASAAVSGPIDLVPSAMLGR